MPLRVTVTIVPHGMEDAAQVVGSAYIENTTERPSRDRGTYSARLYGRGGMHGTMEERLKERAWPIADISIKDFPRSKMGVWYLLKRILAELPEPPPKSKVRSHKPE